MTEALSALAAIVGERHVFVRPEDLARYDSDGRGGGGAACAAVRPADTAEVSAVMRAAHSHGARLVVQGARTGLAGAGLSDGAIVLSLERLAGTPLIDAANRTAEADAGLALSALNEAAAIHGLTFPIDLGADPSIGGMIAANTGGARFLRYGDVRRSLLGAEVVLADGKGTVLQLGGPLWKNNSGLDLKQLIASSAGAIAVITRATIALQPLPASRTCALVALSRAEDAIELLSTLETRAGTLLTAFEGISGDALELTLRHVPRLRRPFRESPEYVVLAELCAGEAVPDILLTAILSDALAPLIESGVVADAILDQGDALWAIRHGVPEGLRAAGSVIACDVALRRGDVMQFRKRASAAVAARWPELVVADFGHVGDGGLHFNMVWPAERGPIPPGVAREVQEQVFALAVDAFGGTFSAEHGVGPRNIEHYTRFTPAPVRALARRVQQVVAPAGLGRVDFGVGLEEQTCPIH